MVVPGDGPGTGVVLRHDMLSHRPSQG
jgi:hypothetical protein